MVRADGFDVVWVLVWCWLGVGVAQVLCGRGSGAVRILCVVWCGFGKGLMCGGGVPVRLRHGHQTRIKTGMSELMPV